MALGGNFIPTAAVASIYSGKRSCSSGMIELIELVTVRLLHPLRVLVKSGMHSP